MATERTVVVAAASRHGSTAEIAERLMATLSERLPTGWSVRAGELSDPRTLDAADAVVLGSGVYLGRWLRPARKALRHVRGTPPLGLWVFSSGPVSDDIGDNARVIAADKAVESGDAVSHTVFAGRLDTSELAWWERLPVRAVHATSGDWRDWTIIDEWAVTIAAHLTASDRDASTDGTFYPRHPVDSV
ncbi:MAG: menaquinone-dependent protoporphyrinogen oxidase [Nocardioidaceae bacterium]|nr:menaquinone-dependent protoporphyrinogen oxidase [Nocardioidaceae bacterium]